MSKRLDDDELNATAILHIIEALRQPTVGSGKESATEHLAIAEKHVIQVLNRGKDQWHPEYIKPATGPETTTVTASAEEAP
jgi:hypothetical protein